MEPKSDPSRNTAPGILLGVFLGPPQPPLAWTRIIVQVVAIGVLDFYSGASVSLAMLYLVPISLATGWRGPRAGVAVSIACTFAQVASDAAIQGAASVTATTSWNSFTALVIYLFLVWLLHSLIALHRSLEGAVERRTSELQDSIADRQRLQRNLLDVSARERSAMGRELHDDLGQHLVATAMACQVLMRKLPENNATEAAAIVHWIEEAIAKTRRLARGLLLSNIAPERFPLELEELATTSSRGELQCQFRHNGRPIPAAPADCAQLFRIAQEAVANALRHAGANSVDITLATDDDATCLVVEDDGSGMVAPRPYDAPGMGLQIMEHRAKLIGASFSILSAPGEGLKVICRLPHRAAPPP